MNELTTIQQQRLGEILKDIQHSQRRVGLEVLTIGQRLLEAKDILWHGDFEDWVEMNCRFTARTAENMMNVARRLLDKPEVVSLLPPGILYQLAAPSTNEKVIDVIATRIRDGETLDNADVEKVIRDNKPPRQRRTVEEVTNETTDNIVEEVTATNGYVSVGGESVPATRETIRQAVIEQNAEAIRTDNETIRRKIEQEDGLEGLETLRGKCIVNHISRDGRVVLFSPALAAQLEAGMRVQYIFYILDEYSTSRPIDLVAVARGESSL
jgi:hypothetical protein